MVIPTGESLDLRSFRFIQSPFVSMTWKVNTTLMSMFVTTLSGPFILTLVLRESISDAIGHEVRWSEQGMQEDGIAHLEVSIFA